MKRPIFHLAFLLVLCFLLPLDARAQGSVEGDRAALVALYDALDGDNWSQNTNWNTSAPLDDWVSVYTNSAGRVTSLNLGINRLAGEIPVEIGSLGGLKQLRLRDNALSGEIPRTFLALQNLFTFLTRGTPDLCLPSILLDWHDALDYNDPISECPGLVGDGIILQALYEALDGDNWKRKKNWLTSKSLKKWKGIRTNSAGRVTHILLGRNNLSGELPAAIGDLRALKWLAMGHNDLTGEIPSEIGDLSKLKRLALHHTHLTGEIPESFIALENLVLFKVFNTPGLCLLVSLFDWYGRIVVANGALDLGYPASCRGGGQFGNADKGKIAASVSATALAVSSAEIEEIPTDLALMGNYPNPFNPVTTIEYALPEAAHVRLVVYDMTGRAISVLLDGTQPAGRHTARFDAGELSTGTYVYRLTTGVETLTRVMTLVR